MIDNHSAGPAATCGGDPGNNQQVKKMAQIEAVDRGDGQYGMVEIATLRHRYEGGEEVDENPQAVSTLEDLGKLLRAFGWSGTDEQVIAEYRKDCGLDVSDELLDRYFLTMGEPSGRQSHFDFGPADPNDYTCRPNTREEI